MRIGSCGWLREGVPLASMSELVARALTPALSRAGEEGEVIVRHASRSRRTVGRNSEACSADPRRAVGAIRCAIAPYARGTVRIALGVLALVAAATAEPAAPRLPAGFVFLRDVAPGIRQDMRYAGDHNFVGRRIAGYGAAECVLTARAAEALAAVQAELAPQGLSLVVWDCYRPARAVADFMGWLKNADTRMKGEFYPRTPKSDLVALGYLAARSGHSGGSTVDVGIVPAELRTPPRWNGRIVPCTAPKGTRHEDGAVDLGTGFDCFDPQAHIDASGITAEARRNRLLLRHVMARHGFAPYDREWWHFRLRGEAFPGRIFDFPVPPRP